MVKRRGEVGRIKSQTDLQVLVKTLNITLSGNYLVALSKCFKKIALAVVWEIVRYQKWE
jgi:hypothetical protein